MSFRNRLAAFLLLTLIAVQLVTVLLAYGVLRENDVLSMRDSSKQN